MNRLWMGRYQLTLPQISTFVIRPGRKSITFLTERTSTTLQHCGVEVSPGDIAIDDDRIAHYRCGANLHIGGMSLAIDDLNTATRAIAGRDFPETLQKRVTRPSSMLMSRLRKLHRIVSQLAHDIPDILEQPQVCRALEEQLSYVMIRCLTESIGIETTVGTRRHDAIVARFEEYLAAHLDRPLYLTEICAGIGVAERTLRACCEEHLGMGPVRYLTLRRMHLVRRALLCADPSKSTVTRIVTDHGFWELGRFSGAYRALFGESPSETLRRPQDMVAINLRRPSSLPVARLNALSW
jgi:AraC-like DNA-binding protein